jgi:P27 family predicted phage terminase small subunit
MTKAKAPSERQGNNNTGSLAEKKQALKATNINTALVPELPSAFDLLDDEYLERATNLWVEVWSMGNGFYRETDAHIIERYVTLQMRRAVLMAQLSNSYTTIGSQGQEVAHPAARLLNDVEGKLPGLEDRLGLNPDARLRLGLAVAETKSKLDAFIEEAGT